MRLECEELQDLKLKLLCEALQGPEYLRRECAIGLPQ
jgi:hypothetical protein